MKSKSNSNKTAVAHVPESAKTQTNDAARDWGKAIGNSYRVNGEKLPNVASLKTGLRGQLLKDFETGLKIGFSGRSAAIDRKPSANCEATQNAQFTKGPNMEYRREFIGNALTRENFDALVCELEIAQSQRAELLEAFKQTITAAEIIDGSENPEDSDIEYLHDSIIKARAAISKAEGK